MWQEGFWAEGFWAEGFWADIVTPSVEYAIYAEMLVLPAVFGIPSLEPGVQGEPGVAHIRGEPSIGHVRGTPSLAPAVRAAAGLQGR